MTDQKGDLLIIGLLGVFVVVAIFLGIINLNQPDRKDKPADLRLKVTSSLPPSDTPPASASSIILAKTKDFNVYTNYQYGYRLEFPSKLNVIPQDELNQQIFGVTNKPSPKNGLYATGEDEPYFEIDVIVSDSSGRDLLDLAAHYDEFKQRAGYKRADFVLDGVKGFHVNNISLDSLTDAVVVIKDDKQYFIGLRYFKSVKPEGVEIYKKILTSFEFLD